MNFKQTSEDQWDSECGNYSILSYQTGVALDDIYMPYKKEKDGPHAGKYTSTGGKYSTLTEAINACHHYEKMKSGLYVFNPHLEIRQLAKEIVEENFPEEHYGHIMIFEAWPMRKVMEQLIEIGIRKNMEEK